MPNREERITEARQHQPIAELERKWFKSMGRWSNSYWTQEAIDFFEARARLNASKMQPMPRPASNSS